MFESEVSVAAAATSATTTTTVAVLGPCFVHDESPAIELLTVQRFDRGSGVLALRHRDEAETSRASGISIRNDANFFYFTVRGEEVPESALRGVEIQIAHVNLQRSFLQPATLTKSGGIRGVQGKAQSRRQVYTISVRIWGPGAARRGR